MLLFRPYPESLTHNHQRFTDARPKYAVEAAFTNARLFSGALITDDIIANIAKARNLQAFIPDDVLNTPIKIGNKKKAD